MDEMKPCPFCGGDAQWAPTYVDRDNPGSVECANDCGATVICYGSKTERIAAWNQRADTHPAPTADAGLVERVARARRQFLDEKPTDEQIIAEVGAWGRAAMTYVVANRLRSKKFNVRTDWVLRQLKRLERAGKVERAPTGYAVQICWRVVVSADAESPAAA